MPVVAKLFVLDEDGNKVGTFVVDLESLFHMYRKVMAQRLRALPDSNTQEVSDTMEWQQDAEGQIHLQSKQPPDLEE